MLKMHARSVNRFKKPRLDDDDDVDINEQQSAAEAPKVNKKRKINEQSIVKL